jgi:hypothetical protein
MLKCSPGFSLASAIQVAIADEQSDEFENDNKEYRVKRKRKISVGDQEQDILACTDTTSGRQLRRPDVAPQPQSSLRELRSEGAQAPSLKLPRPSEPEPNRNKTRKEHRKERKRLKREDKRRLDFISNTNRPRPDDITKFVGSASTISAEIDTCDLPANSSGYDGTFKGAMGDEALNLDDLIADGYELIEWDGRQALFSVPKGFADLTDAFLL